MLPTDKDSSKPKVLIFASGSKDGGGSGLKWLIWHMLADNLPIQIVGIVSNHNHGGVASLARIHDLPFFHMQSFKAKDYQDLAEITDAEWFLCSGWVKYVLGLPENRTINIHPGPTKAAGGKGFHGDHVHEHMVKLASDPDNRVTKSMVSMHFVTQNPDGSDYDSGPTFFELAVPILPQDDPDDLFERVNRMEHGWQWWATGLVLSGAITWSGEHNDPVKVPPWYKNMPYCPEHCQIRSFSPRLTKASQPKM